MPLNDNFADSISQEVLTEMAGNFFGSRKQLENSINIFYEYVKALKEKEQDINTRVSILNFILTGTEILKDFFKAVKINPDNFMILEKFPEYTPPVHIPFALTQKGVFIKLVIQAYSDLEKACNSYMNGKNPDYLQQEKNLEKINSYYTLINEMCILINQDIHKHNQDVSPAMVLQRFKRFDPVVVQKQRITGGSTFNGENSSLSSELAFQPIDIEKLNLKTFPLLRPVNDAEETINNFCKKIYNVREEKIRAAISELRKKYEAFSKK
ncbi:Uncharacterized protein dnl_53930 [Desulfonema limicola]|uniref:Uncharacterized protein n=1 Tax=Desulfonema limicola TaxID=45656 RepID=A0A975BCZ1_9BACT|nr:hypothetical protein [Desulfonema limicola]QTA83000.1 Uncharacterized protein dnl_53930 [Desulfonema limicola]